MATTTSKAIAIGIFEACLIALAVWITWHQTNTAWSNKWLMRDATDLKAQVANAAANAKQEHDWQTAFAAIDAGYQQSLQDSKREADKNLADYRSGIKRLRAQFACAGRNMPDTATAASVRDAATQCGLQPNDVEFLIRFANDAEDTRQQLIAAQTLLKKIYAKPQ